MEVGVRGGVGAPEPLPAATAEAEAEAGAGARAGARDDDVEVPEQQRGAAAERGGCAAGGGRGHGGAAERARGGGARDAAAVGARRGARDAVRVRGELGAGIRQRRALPLAHQALERAPPRRPLRLPERAESHHRGAGSRGGELVLHPSGPPRRGPQDEAGQLHPPLRRRPPPHPRRRPQRARRLRLLRRPLGRHRQVPRGDRQAAAEGGGDEAPQGEALRRRQGLRRRARSRPGGGSQRPRCAGDVQVRHEGGLHPGVAQLAVRLSAGVVRRRPVHGHLGSPHRHGGRRRRRGRGRRRRRRGGEAAAAAEGGEGDEQEFGERDIRRLD